MLIPKVFTQTVCVFLLFFVYLTGLEAADIPKWPQFRGVNSSGIAAESEDPPVHFGPEQNVLWKIALPSGHSSPCIWDDKIFMTGADKDKNEFYTFCIDRHNGKIHWQQTVTADSLEKYNRTGTLANATPATDGQQIYVYFGSYGLLCYDLAGKERWSVTMPVPKTRHGTGTSPIVTSEYVILSNDDQNDPSVMAFDRQNGGLVWKQTQPLLHSFGTESYSTPTVWGDHAVIYRRGEIVAHRLDDGTREWWYESPTGGAGSAIIGKNRLYVGTFSTLGEQKFRLEHPDFETLVKDNDRDGDHLIVKEEFPKDMWFSSRPELSGPRVRLKNYFEFIDENGDTFVDSTEWQTTVDFIKKLYNEHGLVAIKPGGKQDITMSHLVWKHNVDVPEVTSPIYYDGRIYMVKSGGIVTCLDAETGELYYREKLGARGRFYSSPVIAGERVYCASQKGLISVLATGKQFKILAKNDMGEKVYATPAIVDHTLYVRTISHLYAFGVGDGT